MFDLNNFNLEKIDLLNDLESHLELKNLANNFVNDSNKLKYAYVWNWMGLPIIQMPEDIMKVQEVIFETKPDVIIETGVAWGGSLLFYASVLKSIGKGRVIGIDITIPEHNRDRILSSNGGELVTLIESPSTSKELFEEVKASIPSGANVLLILDSHHTEDHVFEELRLWEPLVTKGNYILVCDTIVEFIDAPQDRVRPWGKGNNPFTAMEKFLKINNRFTNSNEYNQKSFNSFHPFGFLKATH
jgi:cephalosporin hydroxylase